MKNDNKADSTIKFARKTPTFLSKQTSLSEPETVKAFTAQLNSKNGYNRTLYISYNKYCKFYKIKRKMLLTTALVSMLLLLPSVATQFVNYG